MFVIIEFIAGVYGKRLPDLSLLIYDFYVFVNYYERGRKKKNSIQYHGVENVFCTLAWSTAKGEFDKKKKKGKKERRGN